jgi:putative endonuclease
MFYVYLPHSITDNGFYIGYSTDLRRRLIEHKQGASFATKHRGPWKLIYYEAYIDQRDAQGRESYLKSGAGRRTILRNFRVAEQPRETVGLLRGLATPHGFEP